jgi:opacity protein-like surface antigen
MSKFRPLALICLAAAFSTAAFASHVEVNFENLNNGDVITNQYAGVVFSSTQGNVNYVTTQAQYQSTPPNFLCSGPANSRIDCMQETILTFTGGAVNNLNFDGMGVNDVGVEALIDVFTNGVFNSTVEFMGNSEGLAPDHIDLSAFSNITSIRIYDIVDTAGIGWDTFQYDQGQQTTPEPSTLVMLGSGLLGAAGILRRKFVA